MKIDGVDLADFVTLPTNPRPAPRARVGNGRGYNEHWYTALKQLWALEALSQINERGLQTYFDGERLRVDIVFFRNGTVGDGDNLSKTATDALNGIWYTDDKQIDDWHFSVVRKIPKKDAYAMIWVEDLPEHSVIDELRQWWRDRRERA